MNLGFPRNLCEIALAEAKGHPQLAADMLLSGHVHAGGIGQHHPDQHGGGNIGASGGSSGGKAKAPVPGAKAKADSKGKDGKKKSKFPFGKKS